MNMEPTILSEIATDTLKGLTSKNKYLLSKYFYDDEGSRIFQEIMRMPEYYLTDCELEIFTNQQEKIINAFKQSVNGFDLIDLGAGDGLKTSILLKQIVNKFIRAQYIPVDISVKANADLVRKLAIELPDLNVKPITGDYFHELKRLNGYSGLRKVFLFLGANIGNFSDEEIQLFLGKLSSLCQKGDKLMIGFDLKKSPEVIMNAYNDPHGHTRRFNLNHLVRLNRELEAHFKPENFEQHTEYNPLNGAVKSFLVSKKDQPVLISALEQNFYFKKWEPIFMEQSRKFDIDTIALIANHHGFKVETQFTDSRNYFVDSLWVKE
jgi:dimethylhistidine N-methyltransferase